MAFVFTLLSLDNPGRVTVPRILRSLLNNYTNVTNVYTCISNYLGEQNLAADLFFDVVLMDQWGKNCLVKFNIP